MSMEIYTITPNEISAIAPLVADFRVALKGYKGIAAVPDIPAAETELREYLDVGYPCFAALTDGNWAGYVVCKVEEPCVWVESIYVKPECRRTGVASQLFARAKALAASYGEEAVFNNVHPNNHAMLTFLRKRGYSVLNLIEVRKPYSGERLTRIIPVGDQRFDY